MALLIAALFVLATLDELTDPMGAIVLIIALLALLAIVLPDLKESPPIGKPPGTDRVLLEAARDIGDGGDPREIAERLRDVDVQEGRQVLCLDMALRCLEGAARFGRLEARLRREAAGWVRMMIKEMK
jgi:hypothetical protein